MKPSFRKVLATSLIGVCVVPLFAQEASADTTALGYKIGHEIGSWLPFLIIFTLLIMVIVRSARLRKDKNI